MANLIRVSIQSSRISNRIRIDLELEFERIQVLIIYSNRIEFVESSIRFNSCGALVMDEANTATCNCRTTYFLGRCDLAVGSGRNLMTPFLSHWCIPYGLLRRKPIVVNVWRWLISTVLSTGKRVATFLWCFLSLVAYYPYF